MSGLEILAIAASATVQDRGRSGFLRYGVTGGGAMDAYGLAEGQALLCNGPDDAAIEFAQLGGRFRATGAVQVALSGAEMAAKLNETPTTWRRSFLLQKGDVLDIGSARSGVYGYLHIAGGFQTKVVLGARATHRRAGFGHILAAGQVLRAGDPDRKNPVVILPAPDYFGAQQIRALWGPQSHLFSEEIRQEFAGSTFEMTAMRDRMGIRIRPLNGPVKTVVGLTLASDAINLGDIQITGDGTPVVLLADRGPSGGYPRIATLATVDLGRFAQIVTGQTFCLHMVSRADALTALAAHLKDIKALTNSVQPVLRDPREMNDLLSYNLVSGALRGDEYDAN